MTGNAGRILGHTATSVEAVILEQALDPSKLCSGDVLSQVTLDSQALFVSLSVPGLPDAGIPAGIYSSSTQGNAISVVYAAGLGGTDPRYAPLQARATATDAQVTVVGYDGHHFVANVVGDLQLPDGGGPFAFNAAVEAFDCH